MLVASQGHCYPLRAKLSTKHQFSLVYNEINENKYETSLPVSTCSWPGDNTCLMLWVGSIHLRKHVEYRPQKKAVISVSLEAGGTAEVAARSHSERSERLVKAFWRHVPIQSHQIYASAQCMSITWLNSYCGSRANTIKYDQIRTLSPLGGRKRINALNESKQMQLKECSFTTLPFLPPAHRRKGFNKGYVTARSRDALGKIPMSKEIQRGVFCNIL